MQNQTIEDKTFKSRYVYALGVLVSVIIATWYACTFVNGYNTKVDVLNTKVDSFKQEMNGKLDIVNLTITNQNKSNKNDRRRDSADYSIKFKMQDEKLDRIQNSIDRFSPFKQRSLTDN